MDVMNNYIERGPILVISDILSLITILSCLVIKVPQIRIINELKSAKGVSIIALLLELFSYSTTMSYNFVNGYAYLSYLEYPILLLQEYVLIFLVLKYQDSLGMKSLIGTIFYVSMLAGFLTKCFPESVLTFLIPFTTPIGATSKVIQIVAILTSKESESISLMTWFISAFTNLTRIYTVYFDSGDMMLLTNFFISFMLSSFVFIAAWYYKKPEKKTE